jgi:hypothetical protein
MAQADMIFNGICNIFKRYGLTIKIQLCRFNRSSNIESTTYSMKIGELKEFDVHSSIYKHKDGYIFNVICEDFILNNSTISAEDIEKGLSKAPNLRNCLPMLWSEESYVRFVEDIIHAGFQESSIVMKV